MKNLKFQFVLLALFLLSIQNSYAQSLITTIQIGPATITTSQEINPENRGEVCVTVEIEYDTVGWEKYFEAINVWDLFGNTLSCKWGDNNCEPAVWCYDRGDCGTLPKVEPIVCSMEELPDSPLAPLMEGSTVIIEPMPCYEFPTTLYLHGY